MCVVVVSTDRRQLAVCPFKYSSSAPVTSRPDTAVDGERAREATSSERYCARPPCLSGLPASLPARRSFPSTAPAATGLAHFLSGSAMTDNNVLFVTRNGIIQLDGAWRL